MKTSFTKYYIILLSLSIAFSDGVWVNYGWELFEHVTDARTASLGNATTAYNFESPTASLINPIFSFKPTQTIHVTHQSRFAGILNNDLIGFQIQRSGKPIQLNLLYEGIGQIPDTRNMLLDWGIDGQFGTNDPGEGNGILDEGERLDVDQIKFFSQHQVGIHAAFNHEFRKMPVGIGVKVLSYSLDSHFALGVGIDIGIMKKINLTNIGIVARNLPASGLIWDNGTVEGTTPTVSVGIHHPLVLTQVPVKLHSLFNLDISTSNRHLNSQIGFAAFSMDASFGLEGIYKDKLFIRLGKNSINNSTGGLGMQWDGFGIDYAFLSSNSTDGLGNHHLISLGFSLDWIKSKLK
ncbi:MAG: hypothetical protein HOB40_09875 [Candidatus Marinimicrobia bacterium]|jgi:hypothetical protein|nr:hypothetical protein [Candidatus Neomarinimicrobiota bacterium]MBT3502422.1 hypothetical protein [Candidatus Neomarinimicrobiota bacterium]MBT3838780.1 hypothetical protein [Candidatus Neomarinimicrobiota bacterium]MBT4578789.1 hypothetical protein [Candidatus Neomarinimicrobiota bacterium]MBT4956982.1 hypothetical protein [Candidatus Neomarinimicrobiota bacterium]